MAKAGYCTQCERLVWLTEDGGCVNGHDPSFVTSVDELEERAEAERSKLRIEGERKQVTVLISDLSGYTAMSEELDAEEVREILSRIFGETAQIVAKYEGYIDKFMGDAVMVLFGIPRTHEDDPVRAIKAAIDIHDLVERMSPRLENKIGRPLLMHSGISTGLVITGETNLEKGTERVLGHTINLASRLTSLARAGEIFVGEETYHLAEGYFNFEVLEPAQVKGKKEPISIYKVLSPKEKPITVHRFSGLRAKLIGRKTELAQLMEAAQQLQDGKGRIIAICGEAGTGKSRLVEEFKATIDKIQWREGHSYAYSQNIPYSLLIDLLNRTWKIEESDSPRKVKEKVESNIELLLGRKDDVAAYIGSLYGLDYPEMKEVNPEFWKSRLQDTFKTIFTALTETKPTVICLEDIHWADPSSVDLLCFILSEYRYPALFLCTYRPPFRLFASREPGLVGKPYQEIGLKDLSVTEAQEMMESLLKTKNIPPELKQFIQGKAEGNPFYLEEVINSLVESEALIRANGDWRFVRPISESDIPLTINGAISARVDRLEEELKRVLQEASVIGRAFLYDILKRVTELREQLDECLNSLELIDLIRRSSLQPDLEYIFKHALTQEVVYNGLLRKDRQALHERIGFVIEEVFRDRLSEFYETLAFHFKQGKSFHKAVDYLMKSGEKSLKRYAVEESHQHYKEAFDLLANKASKTKEEEVLLIDLLNKWSLVFFYRGDFRQLEVLLRTYEDLAASLDDKARLGMFYGWLGMALWAGAKFKDSYQYSCKALKLGEEIGDKLVIGYACTRLIWTSAELGLLDDAITYGERAREISRSVKSDHYLYMKSLGGMAHAYWCRGDSKKAYEVGKALLDYGERQADSRSMVMGYYAVGCSHFIVGDFASAIECYQRALQVSADPWFFQIPKMMLGIIYAIIGQSQEAEGLLREVAAFSQEFGSELAGTAVQPLLGLVLIRRGYFNQGLKMIEDARRLFLENEGRFRYIQSEYTLGMIYSQIAQRAVPISLSTMLKNMGFILKNVPFASKKAEDYLNKAIAGTEKMGAKMFLGWACLGLGLLYKTKGRNDKAKECVSKAIRVFEQCEATVRLKEAKDTLATLR
jgi:class 3 adenylate cyclase/tetratricopeptide (TPR) repeat protein